MTNTEKKFKAAFMTLLSDYASNIVDLIYRESFCDVCPLQKHQWGDCSLDLKDKDDPDACREQIFKWYVEESK